MARVTASLVSIGDEPSPATRSTPTPRGWDGQLEELGISVTLMAVLPDDIERIGDLLRTEAPNAEYMIVTGRARRDAGRRHARRNLGRLRGAAG